MKMLKGLKIFHKSNIQPNITYIIYWEPPEIYLSETHPLLLEIFKGFKDKWTIIDENGQEKEINAIVFFYGLPITKKPKNELDPNLEYLEKATSKHAYYRSAMIWLLEYLENLDYNQFNNLLNLITNKNGIPIKVKELENKDINLYTGVFKGKLNDLYLLIQDGKNIDITIPPGIKWFSIFGLSHTLNILKDAIKKDPRLIFFIMAGILMVILLGAGIYFIFKAFNVFNNHTLSQGPFNITIINGTKCITENGQCIYYIKSALP